MVGTVSMTPERWARLQTLFDEALALDPSARAEFIVAACGEDFSLREQLLSLVMASTDDERFEQRVDSAIAAAVGRDAELPPGHQVGRYRIVRLIGRGGMGAVYLAERADREFEQRVAIKMVADGALSNRIVARLRSERQILANLNHPYIARLLDGGAMAGTPYLVMEFVDGVRIDRYCEAGALDVAARLRLFQQVCAAVQYAHQSLVVHRDIKPSNILVTADGTPKLLDFGIAKLVDPNATTQGLALTRIHERVLTPEHASPEQVRGEQVGTASDVYALGVLLYELLTGLKPYNFNGCTFEQIEKAICEHTPAKPSAAVIAGSELDVPTADASLVKELQGDLDTIVLKAMHKDPQRRYASAGALADDIDNFLASRPISARPDSMRYRAGKFLRRNRWAVSSAAAVVFSIVALTAFYTWRLAIERDTAEVEALKSKQVAEFLVDVFRSVDPLNAQGREVTALNLLDRGAAKIEHELAEQPRVRADLSFAIGASYKALGSYERAEPLLRSAMDLKRGAKQERTREFAQLLYEFANLKRFQGNFKEAEQLFVATLELQRQILPAAHEDTAATLSHLATLYYEARRHEESLALQRQALDMTLKVHGDMHRETADRLNNLGLVEQALGQYREAENSLRRAIAIQIQTLGPSHPQTALTEYNFALLLRATGRIREATSLFERLLPVRRIAHGVRSPRVGFHLSAYGGALADLGEYERAQRLLDEARDILAEQLGMRHWRYAAVLRSIGQVQMYRGSYSDAERTLRAARAIEAEVYGPETDAPLKTDAQIAAALRYQGRFTDAERLIEYSHRTLASRTGGKVDSVSVLVEMAWLQLRRGQRTKAEDLFQQALRQAQPIAGQPHVSMSAPLLGLAQLSLMEKKYDASKEFVERALWILRQYVPESDWQIAAALGLQAEVLAARGETERAIEGVNASLAALSRVRPASDLLVRTAQERLQRLRSLKPAVPP